MSEHNIDWYHKERGGRGPESSTGAVVSHLPGVKQALALQARGMASSAWLSLLWHRKTGAAKIEVKKHDLDWYVTLTDADPGGEGLAGKNRADRSAMSIEFGWTQTHAFGKKLKQPIHHPGLNILGGVMDRAARRYGGG
jgi:hypothetical protein